MIKETWLTKNKNQLSILIIGTIFGIFLLVLGSLIFTNILSIGSKQAIGLGLISIGGLNIAIALLLAIGLFTGKTTIGLTEEEENEILVQELKILWGVKSE